MRKLFFNKIQFVSVIFLVAIVQTAFSQINPSMASSSNKISIINKNWLQGGIFNGEYPEKEILTSRTEYTKKFDKGNGLIDIIFGGPFHYKDKNGALQDINLDIKHDGYGNYAYTNEENRFISGFSQNSDDGVMMNYKNNKIQFGIYTTVYTDNWKPALSNNPVVLTNENSIAYRNIYQDMDLEYKLTTGAMQHSLVFNKKNIFTGLSSHQNIQIEENIELPINATLSDESGNLTTNRIVNGNIFVIINRDTLYTIIVSHAWDASFGGDISELGNKVDLPNGVIDIVTSVSFFSNNKLKLISTIPAKWLMAAERVYPVVFDPTVNIGNVTSFGSTYRYPFNTCRQQRVSQILFRKNDINAGGINTTGNITQIDFLQGTNNPIVNNNIKIKLQEVNWNEMTTSTLTSSGFNTYYGPATQNFTSGGTNTWRPFTLTGTGFPFTNTNNLLMEVSFNNAPLNTSGCSCNVTGPGGHWGYFDAPYHGHRWAYSNSAATPPSGTDCNYVNSPEDNPAYGNLIPAVRITINTAAGCSPINIVSNPGSQTVVAPISAIFTVGVTGTTPTYQWQVSTNGGGNWSNINPGAPYSGITTNQLIINPTSSPMNGYQYRCIVNGGPCTASPVTSNAAVLTVNAAGCSTVIPAASPNIPAAGGGGSFGINVTPNTCSWSASANQGWIIITSPLSGTGDATLAYTVTANNGSARTGTITVNGQNYTVNQLGVAAPTTYTIAGRVLMVGGTGLAGVTITTSPVQGSPVTTDAQGYYTITVPLSYTGTVTPSYSPFTFTPASRIVNSSSFSGKDFNAVGVTMTIASSVIPPWQREGDDYDGSVTVQINNTTSNSWHLEADVYDINNSPVGHVQFPSTTLNTYSFNTAIIILLANLQLKNLSLNGRTVKYTAVFDADPTIKKLVGYVTNIIERQWKNKNIVYFNDGIEQINIPLLYYPNIGSLSVEFFRPNYSNNPCGLSISCNQMYNYLIVGSGIVAQYPTIQNPNKYLLIDPNDISYNLKTVEPGDFTYKITYFNISQQQVGVENGTLEITKIGIIKHPNSIPFGTNASRLMVFIAGIWNTAEEDIYNINNHIWNDNIDPSYLSSKNNYSIISYFNSLGYNTWYIAQGNSNGVRQNAYDLGISLARIKNITGSTDINIITHSKGGLETKALLGSDVFTMSSLNKALDGASYNFAASQLNGAVKRVLFLATPHKGSLAAFLGQNVNPSPARYDLKWDFGLDPNHILNILNNTAMPSNVRFANLTDFVGFDITASGDLAVNMESGTSFNPNNTNAPPFLQLFQNHSNHFTVHTNKILSNNGECLSNIEYTNLEKIKRFFNNQPITNCIWGLFNTFYSGQTIKSILCNTSVHFKRRNINNSEDVLYTDENGKVNFQTFNPLTIGDTILLRAAGVDDQNIIIDQNILNSHKFITAMFKSTGNSPFIQDPSFLLVNQNPITKFSTIQIKVFAKNANQYFINQHNSDNIFIPINSGISNIPLDIGYNKILIKFVGIDTVILSKDIYCYPDTLYNSLSTPFTIQTNSDFLGAKMFVNDVFFQDIKNVNSSIRILNEVSNVKFCKYGYKDTVYKANSSLIFNLSMMPYFYSSSTDSVIFNFNNNLNPQYWKTISIKNISATINKQVSAIQYDDTYSGMSLKPQTRKFVFRKLGSSAPASFKAAIALDQINTPDKDSVYLLYKNGNNWVKYPANQAGVSEYDPEVQKLAFDKLYISDFDTHEIVLMQKQAPLMKSFDTVWHSGQTIAFPISMFVTDPDSIKNDLGITSTDAKVTVNGDMVYITAPLNFQGTTTYTLSGIHDFLDVTKTYSMKVIPPEVYIPTAFTPNKDGLNDLLRPTFLGKLISCHFAIFNRSGQKIYETTDCADGWDGRIKGVPQETGTYVWMLMYQFEGGEKKEAKGTVVLVR